MPASRRPVLILGAGVNGAALARELLLGGVPVVMVDTADACSGASAYSSRLIHGGLRYLEYGEWDLVRESLDERRRLLRLAPHLVRPLRLYIPSRGRLGGWWPTLARFIFRRSAPTRTPRGMWLMRAGLWLYDRYARDRTLPRHAVHRVDEDGVPPVDSGLYRWLCSYSDAQVIYPERLVIAMLEDAQALSRARACEFRLWTYHRARFSPADARVEVVDIAGDARVVDTFTPAAIVNATGAWVDRTLEQMDMQCPRLMGGTRGSHFVTFQSGLRAALGDAGIYVEAPDGRPVFILPFLDGVLVGTTDVPFEGDPAAARATLDELQYLIAAVNCTFPQIGLSLDDVALHYSGVRPLPRTEGLAAAAITRRHMIKEHTEAPLPLFSLIGGKLTTCRALAEETAALVLQRLGLPVTKTSRDRPFPGGENYPADAAALETAWQSLATQYALSERQVAAVWRLFGTRSGQVLAAAHGPPWENVSGTDLPAVVVRWVIDNEWVQTLDDLIERRLMLLYADRLTAGCIRHLAGLLVESSRLSAGDVERQVAATTGRIEQQFGKQIVDSTACPTE